MKELITAGLALIQIAFMLAFISIIIFIFWLFM